ncbi:ATP-binding protein [Fundicoccus culcitae]|uniref:AAA family ATPase n=1 Tax=Fundicoccus culcitae TaxID=2969821 RepID=A0ABY5P5Q6_9LACT|nr:AAA family ATPase [Fundicoccus culcitae]UUX33940.1 AAA family ATPase [Fundicoccus culcitae]
MKIKTLDIYGYGKWVNQRFEINEHLQLFYGKNEAGKSTLQSFIRSILFGFPTRRRKVNQVNRYEPHHSDVYGGRIRLIDTQFGTVWVERTSKIFRVYQEDGTELDPSTLDQILGGLDETLFDNFYAFNLQNLQELSNIDADQLSDYFLSIGTVGSDKFLQIAKTFEKQTDDLYRPQASNRPLNQLLNEYDSLAARLEAVMKNMSRYNTLVEQQKEQESIVNEINQEINQIEQDNRALDKLLGRYDIFIKDKTVMRELDELIYTPIEKEAVNELEDSLRINQQNQASIIQLKERITHYNEEINTLTRLNWAMNHQSERRQWKVDAQKIKDVQSKLEQTLERIEEQNQMMLQLAERGQFYPAKITQSTEYDEKLEEGLGIQANIEELKTQRESVHGERKAFLDHRKDQQNYTAIVRSQAAKLENQRINDEAKLMEQTSLKNYFLGFIFILVGIFVVLLNFNSSNNMYMIIGGILAVIGVVMSLIVFFKHRQLFKAFKESPVVTKIAELREQENQYKDQSNQLGIQINHRDEIIRQIDAEIENNIRDQKRWLVDIGFYPTADSEIILKTNPVKQYFEAKEKRALLEVEKDKLTEQTENWKMTIAELLKRFPTKDESIRSLIRHVEDVEVSLSRTEERGNIIREKINSAENSIKEFEESIKQTNVKIQTILEASDSKNEMEFHQKVEVNQRIAELETKHKLYQEQMVGYEEALENVTNKQALTLMMQKLDVQLTEAKERLTPHQNERANLTVEIQQLEQDGSSQELSQELENKKAEIKAMITDWGRKRIAMNLIHLTLRQGLENPVPEMNELANEIFAKLNYGRYTQIKLNKKGIKVKQFSDILFEPHELSQGTLEQLYVALRLAFVRSASGMVEMPIIIDDAFVNFDEFRKTSMYQVLEKVSEETQVLFFTFDQQAKDSFKDEQRIDLSVTTNNTEKEIVEERD